ncbi:MAG TPA: arabinan endo-1,5-alpha-L-arabinosidase [Tepidisphaeraceae bacterium]|jgi:arabinan endo-1,5-alpha-L-arabinosidase
MKRFFVLCALIISLLFATRALAQTGSVLGVHDPSIIQSGNTFYLFSTGPDIEIRTSNDLFHWKNAGTVFSRPPAWTNPFRHRGNSLWAPDISFFNGEYHIYYASSSFGVTHSAIGQVTNPTLDPADPKYHWTDRGCVVQTPINNNWNALDPCLTFDTENQPWLVLGSCWTGIKLIKINPATGLSFAAEPQPLTIASRPNGLLLEEGYIRRHGDWYYLWVSFDHCCRGSFSDYKIAVGRSKNIQGPYLDRNGKSMLDGGGTLMLTSNGPMRGPGSCAIIHAGNQDWLVHHFYDDDYWGIASLRICQLLWDAEGWPTIGDPIGGPIATK